MKLNIYERLMLLNILPQKGDYATLKIILNAQMLLSPSEEEFKTFGLHETVDPATGNKKLAWNEKGREDIEIELSNIVIKILANKLKELSEAGTLTVDLFSCYEKFVNKEVVEKK